MNKIFWKNKNVLITGFEGFLGSNLTKQLINCEATVIGLDIIVRRKYTVLTQDDYQSLVVIQGTVADYNLLKNILNKNKVDIVFHLAAESIVQDCFNDPLKAFSTNIEGSWKLMEACRFSDTVKAIVIASSDKAYGSHQKLPYKEAAPLIGNHPYDVSKSCADLIANTYFHTFKLPVCVTRCGNIYGPGDFNFSRIIPDTIRCALNNQPILIRSDGEFTRDYVFVDDIVDGYILLAEKLQSLQLAGEAFNFSDENPITVIQLVKDIYKQFDKKPLYEILNKATYEIKHQYLDSKKARKILGWKPHHSLTEGIDKSVAWYKNFFPNSFEEFFVNNRTAK